VEWRQGLVGRFMEPMVKAAGINVRIQIESRALPYDIEEKLLAESSIHSSGIGVVAAIQLPVVAQLNRFCGLAQAEKFSN
jgi:hypothetical protein